MTTQSFRRHILIGAMTAAAMLAPHEAGGVTLVAPPPQLDPAVYTASVHFEQVGDQAGTYRSASQPTQTVTLAATPAPWITTEVEGDVTGGYEARGHISYQGLVIGPDGATDLSVPILVAYRMAGSTFTSGNEAYDGFSDASLTIYGAGCGTNECHVEGGASTNGYQPTQFSQSGTMSLNLLTGYVFSIDLDTGSRFLCNVCDAGTPGYGHATSMIDPVFTIDPTWLAANPGNYGLSFSQGIGNAFADGVPEPRVWTMLIIGFGMIGGVMRRRSRGDCAPAV